MRAAFVALLLSVFPACEPSSASDREKRTRELAIMDQQNRFFGEIDRQNRESWRAYTARFVGKIKPGVGCNACPDICSMVDLRPPSSPAEFKRRYRRVVEQVRTARGWRQGSYASSESGRMGCIAASTGPMRAALKDMLVDPREAPEVRISAAEHAREHGLAAAESLRVLTELSRGSGPTAEAAKVAIDQWNTDTD